MAPSPVSSAHSVDPARLVCYAPRALDQLVVVTETARLLKFSASSGQLLSDVSNQQWKLRKDKSGSFSQLGQDKLEC